MRKLTTVAFLACGLLCGCPQKAEHTTATATSSSSASTPAKPAESQAPKPAESAAPKPAESSAPAKTEVENFWKTVGVGTVVEYTITTDVTKPMKMQTKMTQSQTLSAKDDKGYTLKSQSEMNGMKMPATDQKLEWAVPAASGSSSAAKPQDLGSEKMKVAGGEFDCKHWKTDGDSNGTKTSSESWVYQGLVVKSITKTDGAATASTSTMELTKLEKK